jgi:hypothetical protein
MAYAPSAVAPRSFTFPQKAPRLPRSLFRRLLDAIEQANRRQAEREIARYLGGPGGKFTDETEREIERRFLSS